MILSLHSSIVKRIFCPSMIPPQVPEIWLVCINIRNRKRAVNTGKILRPHVPYIMSCVFIVFCLWVAISHCRGTKLKNTSNWEEDIELVWDKWYQCCLHFPTWNLMQEWKIAESRTAIGLPTRVYFNCYSLSFLKALVLGLRSEVQTLAITMGLVVGYHIWYWCAVVVAMV